MNTRFCDPHDTFLCFFKWNADHLWESAAQLNSWNSGEWDGVDGGGGGGLGLNVGALSSLPMSESSVLKEESGDESTNSSPERLPSYRANRKMPGYSRPLSSIQASLPSLQVMEERSPEELAREDYLMDLAVDAGMELHHARLERAQSRYAMALAYAEVLENIEMEDARSQMAPLLEGTNLKMPSWIRASEQLVPYLDGINEAVAKAEIEDNERELQRIQNSIIDEVDEAIRMLIETDPGASIAALPPTTLPPMESLDDLFGDDDTLLPGVSGDDGAQESLNNNILDGLDGLPDATMLPSLSGLGSSTSIVESALQALSKDFELGIEESELEDIQPGKRKTTGRTLGGSGYGEEETSEEEDDNDGEDDFEDDWPSGGRLLKD